MKPYFTKKDLKFCWIVLLLFIFYQGVFAQWNKHIIHSALGAIPTVCVADMNGDGAKDVVATWFHRNDVAWYEAPSWTEHTIDDNLSSAVGLYVVDMDGDDTLDVVAAGEASHTVAWYEAPLWTKHIIDDHMSRANGVLVVDIDGDDTLDVVAAGWQSDVVWYQGPSWAKHFIDNELANARLVEVVDINGDDTLDVVAIGSGANAVVWYEGPTWNKQVINDSIYFAWGLSVGDLDGDDDPDVVAVGLDMDKISWYENPSWTSHIIDPAVVHNPNMVNIVDINGDDMPDVVAALWGEPGELVCYQAPTWEKKVIDDSLYYAQDLHVTDMDGDTDMDVVASQWTTAECSIMWYANPEITVGIENRELDFPHSFALYQNYPNPFNPKTIINYELPITKYTDLSVYNVLGQKVTTLVAGKQNAGFHSVEWDAGGLASGVYYYRLQAEGFVKTKKLVLLR